MEERYFKFEELMAELAAYLTAKYDMESRDAVGVIMSSAVTQNLYDSDEPLDNYKINDLADLYAR